MATTKEKPQTKEVVNQNGAQAPTMQVSIGGQTISRSEAVEMLKSMTKGEKDSGYLEFEPGIEKRVVFLGWKNIPGLGDQKGKEVPAAMFLVDNGKEQINADAVVVSYFQRQAVGVARQITCTGLKQSANGEYKQFEFHELNMKK